MVATVLVTGATGYTGSHCIKVLLQQGYKVRGTVRSLKDQDKLKFLYNLCPNSTHPLTLVEANLTDEGPWANAVKGCDYVLHVASPVMIHPDATEEEIVSPAVNGTLMVLKACKDSGSVKRVVLTSSNTAVNGAFRWRQEPFTEADWADPNEDIPFLYIKSKILAEKAAWDFMKSLPDGEGFELAVIIPTLIIGASLKSNMAAADHVVKAIMEGKAPMKHGIGMIDVRDVAQAHVNAMHVPAAAGHRHILVSDHLWFKDVARLLKEEFGPQGYDITTEECSDNQQLPVHDKMPIYDGTRAKKVLGINPRSVKSAIFDMAYAMIEGGHVNKKPGYKGPKYSE